MKSTEKIKNYVKAECQNSNYVDDWFFPDHVEVVYKFAQEIMRDQPEADREIVELAVWLHDIQRVLHLPGEHAAAGAQKAKEVLNEFDYGDKIQNQVFEAIRTHRADTPTTKPQTIEAKILATADALAHFNSTFYLQVFLTKMNDQAFQDIKDFKKWAVEKIDRDYHQKMFFEETKMALEEKYLILRHFFASE